MLALTTEPLVRDWKVVDGRILEIEPARRLVMTWAAHWDEAVTRDPASRVTYELTPIDPTTTKLRLVHDDFAGQTATYKGQRHHGGPIFHTTNVATIYWSSATIYNGGPLPGTTGGGAQDGSLMGFFLRNRAERDGLGRAGPAGGRAGVHERRVEPTSGAFEPPPLPAEGALFVRISAPAWRGL